MWLRCISDATGRGESGRNFQNLLPKQRRPQLSTQNSYWVDVVKKIIKKMHLLLQRNFDILWKLLTTGLLNDLTFDNILSFNVSWRSVIQTTTLWSNPSILITRSTQRVSGRARGNTDQIQCKSWFFFINLAQSLGLSLGHTSSDSLVLRNLL